MSKHNVTSVWVARPTRARDQGDARSDHLGEGPDAASVHDVLRLGLVDRAGAASALVELRRRCGSAALTGHLHEVAASVWGQLRRRSRYPIPLSAVLGWLDDGSVGGSIFLTRITGLCAREGADAPVDLLGSLDATMALLEFAGARWWVRPSTVLDRVTAGIEVDLSPVSPARTGTRLAPR